MGKTVLPAAAVLAVTAAMMLATLVALATPAYTQTSVADLAADEDGNLVAPRPPENEVTEDGILIHGGDVLVPCSQVGTTDGTLDRATPQARAEIEQSRRESIRACQAAGFDTAGDLPASASASGSASAPSGTSTTAGSATAPGSVSPSSSSAHVGAALPETGGPVLPALLLTAAAVLLSAGGLLALRARRSY